MSSLCVFLSFLDCFEIIQAVWKKIQSLGLSAKYNEDPTFAAQVAVMFIMNLLPANLMLDYWNFALDLFDDYRDEETSKLLVYFESNFIGYDE